MSTLPQTFVGITPRELKFDNVQLNQSYTQQIHLENTLSYPVSIEIKAGNSFRYTLSESAITLPSHESKHIDIALTLTKPISAKTLKIKDIFYIKSDFFNDHITASIRMSHHNHSQMNDSDASCSSEIPYHSVTPNHETHKQREYVRSLENHVSELKIELDYLSTVKSQINASIPDLETIVDATIGQERALNEVRNKKVLQILQTKDEEIETLKEMSRNYQAMEASLHVLQKKHVHLTQKYTELQTETNHLRTTMKHDKQEMTKLNDKIASYAQQSQFQKKIVHERDTRIKELTADIQQTQQMLTKSTETMKHSYSQQIKDLQSKLTHSNKSIQRITNEFKAKETKYKNDLVSWTQITDENRALKEYKETQQATFEKELRHIQKDASSTIICSGVDTDAMRMDREKQINGLQIELAKLRAFVRLGLFSDDQNIIDYQKGKNINKEMMNELARKSAHLSASQAIIQQQRARLCELEKVQKMTNHSVFEQSVKLNESNKKLTNHSAEHQRLLTIHKRQIEILNKKLSASIKREEQINIKWKNLKQKLNASERDYVDKIEELEQALQAINTMHQKSKRKPSSKPSVAGGIEMVEIENKWMQTQNELVSVRKKLRREMTQRKLDIKAHDIKLQNTKQVYEKQIQRMQSMVEDIQSNNTNANVARMIQLNHELGQSEALKNEYRSEIQILRTRMETKDDDDGDDIDCKYQHTMNTKRDELLLAMNDKCFKQKEEIQDLENMMTAAISELKKYNPDIIDKLQSTKHAASTVSASTTNILTHEHDGIVVEDQITKIKHICDAEIHRYQQLYQNIDDEYQAFKNKINDDIQHKDECYLNELAQQKSQITKLQSEIAELRKSNLDEQQSCQTLQIANQSLAAKLEHYSELQTQHDIHTAESSLDILPSSDSISASKMKESDIKRMEEIITHQEAQIQVLMSTIETLQHHKPKKSQIVELSGRLAVHETLEAQRKKELEIMRSKWQQEQESKAVLEKQCGSIRAKVKSLKFELENTKQQNESIRNRFEHYQRQIIDKENKIHELELTQSRLQSIRKQLESRANIMQNELDHLSKQHFQHLQSLSNEHQNQLKKLTTLYGNNTHNNNNNNNNHNGDDNDTASMNHSLQTNVATDFHDSLKSLSHLLEKYLIHEQQLFDDEKRKLGLTSIEYASLMNSFKNNKKGKSGIGIKSKRKTLESIHTIQDKHQFMKQLMNIVNEQYGNILSLQKQAQFYEWLSRHHYTKRRKSETSVLSIQCELQVNKKHLKRVKSDMDHRHLMIQQQIQQRKDLMKEQMNKAIHRYLVLETKCNTLRSELRANKKQCTQFESKYYTVLNQLNIKSMDGQEKEAKLKETIADELSIHANGRDKKLKEYLHDHLKQIIEDTVRRYQKNDLYENQVFELSNEILSLKYVQHALTQQLEKALFDNEDDKNKNKRLRHIIKSSNTYYEKMKKQQNETHVKSGTNSNHSSNTNSISNSACVSPKNGDKTIRRSAQDASTMELEQDLCDKKLENESLRNTIHGLQKEIEELLEQSNINKMKHEDELKNTREQIGQEREILIQNHHHEMASNHQQHQQKIQKLQNEMEQVSKRVRPWTDSLDLNQLKQTVESQSHELSRANIHLQTLRTKITQLEYESSDNQKEMESQAFVIDHLQDTIKLFSANHEDKEDRASKPCTNWIVSVLCKELVKARKCQSNAMIKLRVASQSEIELQETISSREKRITELKKHLNMNRAPSGQGQVMDIMKKDRKLDEMILELASKDAEIRYLKKKLAIEQTKITVVYDIQPLQELVDKIDVYCHHQYGSKLPFKLILNKKQQDGDMDGLHHQIRELRDENKRLKECEIKYISDSVNSKHDRLEISQCKSKLNYLVQELNGYIHKVKSVCNVSLSKASQRTALKLKKIEDLCKLQHIKITTCSDQINQLLVNVIQSVDIFNEQYDGLQVAHKRLQQHITEEKTKYVEMEQELDDIRVTLETYKSAEKRRNRIQTCTHSAQTEDIPIDFETKSKLISLQNTIKSLRKSKDLEAQDWREDVVSLHEQLLQSKIDVNRYQNECHELQSMYMELKAQLQANHNCGHRIQSPTTHHISDHRLQLQSIELKRKIASLQRQLNDANHEWKAAETKYQKLSAHNMDLKQKSERLDAATKQLNGDHQQRFSELESICDTLQHELKDTKAEYQKQSAQYKKIKDKNHKLKTKNDALTQQTQTTERRSEEEASKLREQLICAQSENKKIRDLVEELQHQIIASESNINKIKCDNDADIEITSQSYRSKIRDLRDKYDKERKDKNEQIKQDKELYEEEQAHHTQHFNELMQQFDEYKATQTRIKKMYEIQLNILKKRFENAIIAEQERLSFVNDARSVHSNSTTSLRKAKSPNSTRSRHLGKSQSMSRVCVSDYSSLLYDLSQRDAAIKSLKNELKSLKLTLKKKEREYQKILSRNKDKKRNHNNLRSSSSPLRRSVLSPTKDKTNSLFEIRASAVWSARLAHCTIRTTELTKKLEFEQQMTIQKEEDIENYKFETKQLKLRICNLNKKLEHQMGIKSKKNQSWECERQTWRAKEKEWEQEKEKLNQHIAQCKNTIKRLRDDIHRKEDIMKQIKEENEKIKEKMKCVKLKSKSMSFCHSDQYKELHKEIECMKNKVSLKESLLSDVKRKHERLQSHFDKIQLNNHELHSKNRTAHSEISRKDILIKELKHKLESVERENISNKTHSDLITKLKQKCKQLKKNENRKDELWRSNKQRLESVMKELNTLKAQNEQKQSKIMTKLNKIQNDEQSISKKYEDVRNESIELKAIVDSLYHKLAVVNDDLVATLNELQSNYYKQQCMQQYNNNNTKKKKKKIQSDDTLEAARIVDGFSVNELEEIMQCKEEKKQQTLGSISPPLNRSNTPKAILWDKYGEKRFIVQLFEKLINERIRLEMMIHKMKIHQNKTSSFDNDQFEKIKMKHQQHLNEYQSMLNKFRKHK